MLPIEPFDIYSIVTGTFRLDGGAMFGVVPRVLWAELVDVDDQNRILLATRTLLAVDNNASRVVLVDTGCGNKWTPEKAARFAIQADDQAIDRALHSLGLARDDVTDVVVTHLHFDHNGGLTDWVADPGGATRLRYPHANHWMHARHWAHARHPHIKDRASFLPEDFAALIDSDRLRLVDGDHPPSPFDGLQWWPANGHTTAQLLPVFGRGDQKLLFVGDVVPTANHLRLPWVMAYDLLPMTTIEEKQAAYRHCLTDGWLLAFPHDPKIGGVRLSGSVDRPEIQESLFIA